ncbi:MAG: hypothetical protein JWO78_1138 [Micavibrio sp.]|nr:hypothetical protein [Micavibrio sp.]
MKHQQFSFLCKDKALNDTQAKDVIESAPDLKLVDSFSKTFLVEATQTAADAFAAANSKWKVFPVVLYKLPDTRFKIKPPTQG